MCDIPSSNIKSAMMCSHSMVTRTGLRKHRLMVVVAGEAPFSCIVCALPFAVKEPACPAEYCNREWSELNFRHMNDSYGCRATLSRFDAYMRQLCTKSTSLDSPWSGTLTLMGCRHMRNAGFSTFTSGSCFAGGYGVGLVKRNDNTFPSRAQTKSFKGKGRPGPSTPRAPRSPGNRGRFVTFVGMEYVTSSPSEDAWKSWMDQSANLDELGAPAPFSPSKRNLSHAVPNALRN